MTSALPLRRSLWPLVTLGLGAGVLTGCSGDPEPTAAAGGDACSSLEGETVSLVVPYDPGGGYDSYTRMVAPYLEEELGATVVVENQPGAGGLLALNNLLAEDPDGTTLAIMNGVGAGGSSIAGAEGANFSLEDFTYIGRVASDPSMIVTSATGPYQSWEDVLAADQFRWGSTGPGAEDYVTSSLLKDIFDIPGEVVTGFPGSGETELAVIQGNVDGMSGNITSRRGAVEEGTQTPVLVVGEEKPEWVPEDVPTVKDIDTTEEQAAVLDAHLALIELGRPFVGPPGMEEDVTSCLRDAMDAAMNNPELVEESVEQERELAYVPGDELEDMVQRISDAPPAYADLLKTLY